MTTLHLALLGGFQVKLENQSVTAFESDKVRALLAFLAVEAEQPHRREALAALLWPNMPDRAARRNLRHALANLRRAIGDYDANPPFLTITRQTLQFNQDCRHTLDVSALLSATNSSSAVHQMETAVSLYRGDFLMGLSVAASVAFDEWATVKREQYHQRFCKTLSRLAGFFAQCGQYERALTYAKRHVDLEPWDEISHQQLMRLLALNEQRGAAILQYETCCRILNAELGVLPTAATTTLYEHIRDQTWPNDAARRPLPRFVVDETDDSPPPPVIAREPALQQLHRFLKHACGSKTQVAFIRGEAGSGKTFLMDAFARQAMAAHPNLLVASGQSTAYTGSGDPYLPFLAIMQMLTGDVEARWEAGDISTDHARRLWAALPDVSAALVENGRSLLDRFVAIEPLLLRNQIRTRHMPPSQLPWLARLQAWGEMETAVPVPQPDLFSQFTALLAAIAQQHPMLLLLDDLQWIDSGSLNLLFHLGHHLRGSRIFILGAFRPVDMAAEPGRQPHPLVGIVNEFQRMFGANPIDLSMAGGRPFVDALLDNEPNRLDETFRDILHQHTGGQALFTTELLRGLQERGDLFKDLDGYWVAQETLDWSILPAAVEAAIAGRINRLPENCRAALTIASVEGETFTAELVAKIQQQDEQETIRCLSGDLGRRHRLVTAQSSRRLGGRRLSRYRFHHHFFQKYLYGDLDPVERARLHEAVGDALEELYAAQKTAVAARYGQLAWHFQEAGALDKAISYYQKAGERAWQLAAGDEAVAYLQTGLSLLEAVPDSPQRKQQELGLQMSLAMPLQAAKGFAAPEVQQTYDRAYLLSRQIDQTLPQFSVLGLLGSYYLTSGQYHTSLKIAQQQLELGRLHQDGLQIALARLGMAANCAQLGRFDQSRVCAREVLAYYDYHQHRGSVPHYGIDPGVNGHIWAALVLWVLGYPEQANRHCRDAVELAKIVDHPFSLAAALEVSGGILCIWERDYDAAFTRLRDSLQLAAKQKFGLFQVEGMFYQGFLLVQDGQHTEGLAQMRDSLAAWRATGMRILYSQMLGLLAQALGLSGQPEEGVETVDKALAEVTNRDEWLFAADLYRIKGDLLRGLGVNTAVIESTYQQAIGIAQQQHAKSWELRAAISLAKLWQSQGHPDKACSLLSEIYSWFTEGFDTPDLREAHALLN